MVLSIIAAAVVLQAVAWMAWGGYWVDMFWTHDDRYNAMTPEEQADCKQQAEMRLNGADVKAGSLGWNWCSNDEASNINLAIMVPKQHHQSNQTATRRINQNEFPGVSRLCLHDLGGCLLCLRLQFRPVW